MKKDRLMNNNPSIARHITEYASQLFDVAGFSQLSSAENLLITGLESTPERDLDEFGRINGIIQMYGFKKHAKPRLEALLNFIHDKGFAAELVGQYGYPTDGKPNLKKEAIFAGLGKRGKNTIVLHPRYGHRLRFMAIKTNAPLEPLIYSSMNEAENPVCSECSICIDICPVKALEPYRMPDPTICLANTNIMDKEQGRLVPCDLCLSMCPAGEK